MLSNRRSVLAAAAALSAVLTLAAAGPAGAVDEVNVSRGLTAEGAPLAVHGYDPVAFFTRGAAVPGDAAHATVHEGAAYYFATKEHRRAFEADPERYLPAYGGYCAYGVSVGKKFDGDPRFWTISGGRLYLNLNAQIAAKFAEDVPGAIAKADKRWRRIGDRAVADL